ncbi:unknown [Clostridium sp. CAG:768]|nr:unknown [Clostridium sp. CAG:768]
MNITINSNTYANNRLYNQKQNNNSYKPNFKANAASTVSDAAEQILEKASKSESSLFKPITDAYEKMTDSIADKFTSKFVDSKPLDWLADKLKNSKNLFQHCLTVGSVITSGLYMQRTLTNKELDKDRKNTLAVNQGLTFAVSTVGAYALDKYVKGWWDNVTARFAGHLLGDNKFYSDYLANKAAVIKENKELLAASKGSNIKPELKEMPSVIKSIENNSFYKSLLSNAGDDAKTLMTKVKGMSPLRTMIVFGFVYRYFVPVVVTKPANILCEKYLAHKKAKTENKQNA